MKSLSILLLLFIFSTKLFSQGEIERNFNDGSLEWYANKILETNDHGFLIHAISNTYGEYDNKINDFIVLDSLGTKIWNYSFNGGDAYIDYSDGGFGLGNDGMIFILNNELGCMGFGGNVLKYNSQGTLIWDRTNDLGLSKPYSLFYTICSTLNNEQIIGGSIGCQNTTPYLCKIDTNANTVWEYTLDSLFPGEYIRKIERFQDSTFLVHLVNHTIQINENGDILSSNFPNGVFIIARTGGFIKLNTNQIIRLDDSLNVTWTSPVYCSNCHYYSIAEDSLNNIYVTGKKDTSNGDILVSRFDSIGTLNYTKLYGGALADQGNDIIITDRNEIAIAGNTHLQNWKFWEDHFYECQLFPTYFSDIKFIKTETNKISTEQIQSSTGLYSFCDGDSLTLTAPSGFSYLWNTGETSQNIVIDTTGAFFVTITDQFSRSELLPNFNAYKYPIPTINTTDDVTITQCSGNFDMCLSTDFSNSVFDRQFTWYRNSSYFSNNTILFSYTGLPAGSYFYTSSNQCGIDTSNTYFLLTAPPQVDLGNDTTLCTFDSIQFVAGNEYYSYLWQDGSPYATSIATSNVNDTLIYFVTKTDLAGCAISDTVSVFFQTCLKVESIGENDHVTISPNPFNNQIILKSIGNTIDEIRISDNFGRVVLIFKDIDFEKTIDTSKLPPGFYFIEVLTQNAKHNFKLLKANFN